MWQKESVSLSVPSLQTLQMLSSFKSMFTKCSSSFIVLLFRRGFFNCGVGSRKRSAPSASRGSRSQVSARQCTWDAKTRTPTLGTGGARGPGRVRGVQESPRPRRPSTQGAGVRGRSGRPVQSPLGVRGAGRCLAPARSPLRPPRTRLSPSVRALGAQRPEAEARRRRDDAARELAAQGRG